MNPYKRSPVLQGRTIRLNTPCGSFYLTLNEDEGKLREVRMRIGKSGNCQRLLFETISILLSVLLQSNMPRERIKDILYHQLDGNCGNDKIWHDGKRYDSCIDFVITQIFEDLANHGEITLEEET